MDHMEDGELVDTVVGHGEKRDHSLIEEETYEETLSIKPPPVKKHKRHHKKHKNGKEEKKKKRRVSGERNHKSEIIERPQMQENGGRMRIERRIPEPVMDSRRDRDNSSRLNLNDRLQHRNSDKRNYSNDRTTQKYTNSGNPRDQSRDSRDAKYDRERNYMNNSNSRVRPPPHRNDMDRKGRDYKEPGYRQKPIEDARGKINQRREEAKSNAPLLIRQFDNDEYRARNLHRDIREERGKHDRSISSSVLLTSHSNNSSAPSRKSDSGVLARRQNDRENEAFRRLAPDPKSDRRDPVRKRREERPEIIERKKELNPEVISSEDSSDSSSESESGRSGTLEKEDNGETRTREVEESSGGESEEEGAGEVEVDSSLSSSGEEEESSSSDEESGGDTDQDEEAASGEEGGESEEEEEQKEEDPRSRFDSPSHPVEEDEVVEVAEEAEAEEEEELEEPPTPEPVLPFYFPAIQGCRSVDEFQCLNRVEEGTYGVVYRAKDKRTDQVVALKRLKMEKEREGFPITSLREVSTLLKAHHPNVVGVQEIVVGSNVDKIYIVMEYVEHDLKTLMETMKQPFLVGEVKTIMIQLLRGIHHLHDNWILHRDLKTSNLLLSHKGILKIADFGLAREYGSPLKPYTPIVVTLWYRSPELLLGAKEYSVAVDMWSVGCIFAELLSLKALFPGRSEIMQLNLIFKELGSPSEKIWPGYNELPIVKKTTFAEYPYNTLRKRFGATDLSDKGFDLLNRFLTYCPAKRITSLETLKHEWFNEKPKPVQPSMFPTWPAKSEQMKVKKTNTEAVECPKPPEGAMDYNKLLSEEIGFQLTAPKHGVSKYGTGFSLQF